MKKLRLKLTIENKILIPFLAISMLSILCFGIILYYNGYTVKMSNNLESANTLVRYIETDLDTMLPLTDSDAILEKYHDLGHERIEIFDENGVSLLGGPVYQTIPKENIIAESRDNALSWRICYILDREDFQASLLEEQKYIIIATIALLIITVQVSIQSAPRARWKSSRPGGMRLASWRMPFRRCSKISTATLRNCSR